MLRYILFVTTFVLMINPSAFGKYTIYGTRDDEELKSIGIHLGETGGRENPKGWKILKTSYKPYTGDDDTFGCRTTPQIEETISRYLPSPHEKVDIIVRKQGSTVKCTLTHTALTDCVTPACASKIIILERISEDKAPQS